MLETYPVFKLGVYPGKLSWYDPGYLEVNYKCKGSRFEGTFFSKFLKIFNVLILKFFNF